MVAIKDMEMPKSCRECRLTYPRWDFNIGCKVCNAIIGRHEEYGEYKTKRHPDCPLVEIITCKDCSHYTEYKALDGITYVGCYKGHSNLSPDFYCADAERGENETN